MRHRQIPRATLALDRHFHPVTRAGAMAGLTCTRSGSFHPSRRVALRHLSAARLALNENPEGVEGSLPSSFFQTHQSRNSLPLQGVGRVEEQGGAQQCRAGRSSQAGVSLR